MCPWQPYSASGFIYVSVKIFLLTWIVFVPIVMTARLEKIIKLLEEQNKK